MSIWQCIQELKGELSLRKQFFRLEKQTQQAQINHVIFTVHKPCQKSLSFLKEISELKWQWSSMFILHLSDLHIYYNRITCEHYDWFCDIKDAIEVSILYFLNDTVKI